ncbi:MAG TPA: hypothetical protein VMD99_01675 [Terriglobales bacterium]|nr:hypothetical protein [Terriglobales bacterium]
MNGLRFSKPNRPARAAWAILACFTILCVAAVPLFAQNDSMSPYQGEKDGVSAGGKWMVFESEDKMTGAHKVRFELLADNYLKEDPDYKPRVNLFCSGGKLTFSDFNPGARLAPPNRPGFWGQPQMEVMVRVNDTHSYHGWNWIRGRALSMDKGTTREMIGADIFKVEVTTRGGGREIAEFSPAGLDLSRIKQACDLTPKKPSKD